MWWKNGSGTKLSSAQDQSLKDKSGVAKLSLKSNLTNC